MKGKLDLLLAQHGGRYQDLVAVGTASCEGRPDEESGRARDRADLLILWLREALSRAGDADGRHLYRLNLGKVRSCEGTARKTDDQRRVILVAIKDHGDLELGRLREALREELDDASRLPLGFPLSSYSEFLLDEAR